jgi:hypothetical protein
MDYRNAVLLEDGRIKCEFFHPERKQWEPISCSDADREYYPMALYELIRADLGDDIPTAPPPPLDLQKEVIIGNVQTAHAALRHEIAEGATVERALAWVLKLQFAGMWAMHEQTGAESIAEFAAIARRGFELEAQLTGEDAADLRDRTLTKGGGFFVANQAVEGMARLAEHLIPAAETKAELTAAITRMREADETTRRAISNLRAEAGEPPEE